jgi:endoglucanase
MTAAPIHFDNAAGGDLPALAMMPSFSAATTARLVSAALCFSPLLALSPARAAGDTSASHLALPSAAFPRGAHVVGNGVKGVQADAASGLHVEPGASLGRSAGYLQRASWQLSPHRQLHSTVTLQYIGSRFHTAADAAAFVDDARASLWELGTPLSLEGLQQPAFEVRQQHGAVRVVAVLQRGTIAVEVALLYHDSLSHVQTARALAALAHAARVAAAHAGNLDPTWQDAPQAGLPPVYVAPAGTGPVVKSPSLMLVGADPGSFRSGRPPLADRSARHASLAPAGGLARYVRVRSDTSGAWYESVSLYASPAGAAGAFAALAGDNDVARSLNAAAIPHFQPPVTESRAWQGARESVVALRIQNVVMVVARNSAGAADTAAIARQMAGQVPTWLHAQGTSIVDQSGVPVHLVALNWYGAESPDFVVGGLDYRPYTDILQTMVSLGYNAIRLPFSNQLVEQNPVVTAHIHANPQFAGLHALTIMDRIIAQAGALGLRVILDNHRSDAGWSSQPLWYTQQYPDSAFVADWKTMATRYAGTNAVIAADLRNEPHGAATWGDGNPATDWRAAAERAGNAALAANPHLLIMVEGVQNYPGAPSAWWGGNLMGVATAPVVLQLPDGTSAQSQLVYSPHDYGPSNCGGGCPWFNSGTTYASLAATWDQFWGYIALDPSKPYAAPLFLGEFGTCNRAASCVSDTAPGSQGQWFSSLVQYLGERNLGWAYWSVNGTQSSGSSRSYGTPEGYGLLQQDWSTPHPWLNQALKGIQ